MRFRLEGRLYSFYCVYALTDEKQQIYKLTARHRVPRCELVDLLFLKKIVKNACKSLNVLTPFYKCLLNPSSESVVLKLFHVKDPQSYMYLAVDPHLKICCSRDPPEAEI